MYRASCLHADCHTALQSGRRHDCDLESAVYLERLLAAAPDPVSIHHAHVHEGTDLRRLKDVIVLACR